MRLIQSNEAMETVSNVPCLGKPIALSQSFRKLWTNAAREDLVTVKKHQLSIIVTDRFPIVSVYHCISILHHDAGSDVSDAARNNMPLSNYEQTWMIFRYFSVTSGVRIRWLLMWWQGLLVGPGDKRYGFVSFEIQPLCALWPRSLDRVSLARLL